MRTVLFLLSILIGYCDLFSQSLSVSGKIMSKDKKENLIGANILLTDHSSQKKYGGHSDKNGFFKIENLPAAKFLLRISFVGYKNYDKEIEIKKQSIDLGIISLLPDSIVLKEVTSEAEAILMQNSGDTVQYDPKALKLREDDVVEDVLRKLPDVEVSRNGEITAKGEKVNKVLIDKKPFFGNDKKAAIESVPANMIKKVQVYKEESEQAKATGFADDNGSTVMNLETKPNMRLVKMQSLKLSSGYGTNERYIAGGNYQNRDTAFSFMCYTGAHNLNVKGGFSPLMELMGGGFYTVQPASGSETKTFDGGLDFSIGRMSKESFALSYLYNYSTNKNETWLRRDYYQSSGIQQQFFQTSNSGTDEGRHTIRLGYSNKKSDFTSFSIYPDISITKGDSRSESKSNTVLSGAPISEINSNSKSDNNKFNLAGSMLLSHKFISGNSISLGINGGRGRDRENSSWDNTSAISLHDFLEQNKAYRYLNSTNWKSELAYTLNLDTNNLIQFKYNVQYVYEDLENPKTIIFEDGTKLDSTASGNYENNTWKHSPGIGYNYKSQELNISLDLYYDIDKYAKDQILPYAINDKKNYKNLNPSANLTYRIWTGNLNLKYSSRTELPALERLQNVLDNRNPLQLSIGNPDLKESRVHSFTFGLSRGKEGFLKYFDLNLTGSFNKNFIGTSRILAAKDTIVKGNIQLKRGAQLTYPENIDNQYRGVASLGFKSSIARLPFSAGVSYSQSETPTKLNDKLINSKMNILNCSFNIWPTIASDFANSTSLIYSKNIRTSENAAVKNNYSTFTGRLWFVYKSDLNLNFSTNIDYKYNSISFGNDKDNILIDASVSYMLFKRRAELKLTVYDLLNDKKDISTAYTELYSEESKRTLQKRNIILSFSYKFNLIN